MAKLPPGDHTFIIEKTPKGNVKLMDVGTGHNVVIFDPKDLLDVAGAQKKIHRDKTMNPQQKVFAHFWSGYFFHGAKQEGAEE